MQAVQDVAVRKGSADWRRGASSPRSGDGFFARGPRRTGWIGGMLLAGMAAVAPVRAGSMPSTFTLGRYVPGDAWMYVHKVNNPKCAWLQKRWKGVFQALRETGVDRDAINLVLSLVGEQNRAEVEAQITKWTELLGDVHWAKLVEKEFAFAERFTDFASPRRNPMGADYMALFRSTPEEAAHNASALATILKELSTLSDTCSVNESKENGITRWRMTFGPEVAPGVRLTIELFHKGDLIGLTNSAQAAADIVALMNGTSKKGSILESKRFQAALAQVDSPEDAIFFADVRRIFADIDRAFTHVEKQHLEPKVEQQKKQLAFAKKIVGECNFCDYSISTTRTEERRQLTHEVVRFQEGKKKCRLACAITDRKPFTRFDRYIPADATEFTLESFIDLEKIYALVLDFIRESGPEGEQLIAQWNQKLKEIGFDPQADLFAWWSGEMISITMPAAVVTPMSPTDSVFMIRVKDADLARRKVFGLIDLISQKLQESGQTLMVTPATVDAEGFRQVTHPALMMFLRPVIGVHHEWLMVGTSPGAINKCLAVASGKAPSIAQNDRFRKEGLMPKGPVRGCSFRDMSKMGQQLASVAAMAGMISGMVTASIPDDPPPMKKAKEAVQTGAGIVMKLAPVLQKIDFYRSTASVCTFDGDRTIVTRRVLTYQPESDEVKTAAVP